MTPELRHLCASLTRLVDPGVPEPVDPAALRRVAWMALVLDAVLVSGNIATRFALGPKCDAAVYEVFLAWNLPGHAVMLAALVTLLRSSCELPAVRGRLLIVLAAWAWTVAPARTIAHESKRTSMHRSSLTWPRYPRWTRIASCARCCASSVQRCVRISSAAIRLARCPPSWHSSWRAVKCRMRPSRVPTARSG